MVKIITVSLMLLVSLGTPFAAVADTVTLTVSEEIRTGLPTGATDSRITEDGHG